MTKPTSNNILIEPIGESEKTKSGIIIPKTVDKEKPERGKVLEIGKDVEEIKKGDMVIFVKYSSSEIKINGREYLIAKEEDILAIYE